MNRKNFENKREQMVKKLDEIEDELKTEKHKPEQC